MGRRGRLCGAYAQAHMPGKRRAKHKAVEMVRPEARQEALGMET